VDRTATIAEGRIPTRPARSANAISTATAELSTAQPRLQRSRAIAVRRIELAAERCHGLVTSRARRGGTD
jgi:hypothetical protein